MRAATSSITRRSLAGAAAFSATTAGLVGIAPAASASATSISIHTAGTKQVGAVTSAWGTVNGDGAGVLACTQVLVNGTWSQSQCAKTTSGGAYAIELTYGKTTAGTTTWRVVADGKTSPTATLTRTGGSTTSGSVDYVKGRTPEGFNLVPSTQLNGGTNGVKVYLVERALGLTPKPMDSSLGPVQYYAGGKLITTTLWKTAVSRIKSFQTSKGLPATGVVNDQTYYALKDFAPNKAVLKDFDFNVDQLAEKPLIAGSASQKDRAAKMVTWAKAQVNKPYIWGGTGPMGYDCSGLLLQAMRAGGVNPTDPKVTNKTNVEPPSRLAQAMFDDHSDFTPVPLNALKAGDFVFFGSSKTRVGHVAIVLNSNQMIHAIGSTVQITPLTFNTGWPVRVGAARVR